MSPAGSTGSPAVPARCLGSACSKSTAAAAILHPAQGCPAKSHSKTTPGAAAADLKRTLCTDHGFLQSFLPKFVFLHAAAGGAGSLC